MLEKKNWNRVPCAGDGVEVNDAIVTVNVQGVGDPEGEVVVVGELPHAAQTTIAVANSRVPIQVLSVTMIRGWPNGSRLKQC